jgi:tetratricopeptide (TPR) repeat protein
VDVLGNTLPPGTYALYAFPGEETWEVVFHKNTGHWGDGRTEYDASEDALRVEIRPVEESDWQENFLISFDSLQHNGAVMRWKWGYTALPIPLKINTRAVMLQAITRSLEAQPSAQTYYEAGRYLQEEGLEPEKALDYLEKAIALGGDTYYFYRVRSLVQAELGDYPAAIASALRSLELARAQGKDEFVRMNQEKIKAWKKALEKG